MKVEKDSRPECKFFNEGRCKYGATCRYRHAPAAVANTATSGAAGPARGPGPIANGQDFRLKRSAALSPLFAENQEPGATAAAAKRSRPTKTTPHLTWVNPSVVTDATNKEKLLREKLEQRMELRKKRFEQSAPVASAPPSSTVSDFSAPGQSPANLKKRSLDVPRSSDAKPLSSRVIQVPDEKKKAGASVFPALSNVESSKGKPLSSRVLKVQDDKNKAGASVFPALSSVESSKPAAPTVTLKKISGGNNVRVIGKARVELPTQERRVLKEPATETVRTTKTSVFDKGAEDCSVALSRTPKRRTKRGKRVCRRGFVHQTGSEGGLKSLRAVPVVVSFKSQTAKKTLASFSRKGRLAAMKDRRKTSVAALRKQQRFSHLMSKRGPC